jgi:flagellin-like protein
MTNDKGISSVISVILMVAITMILVAVIAAFVFIMAGNIQQTPTPSPINVTVVDSHYIPPTGWYSGSQTILSSDGNTYYFIDYYQWHKLQIGDSYHCQVNQFGFDTYLENCTEIP